MASRFGMICYTRLLISATIIRLKKPTNPIMFNECKNLIPYVGEVAAVNYGTMNVSDVAAMGKNQVNPNFSPCAKFWNVCCSFYRSFCCAVLMPIYDFSVCITNVLTSLTFLWLILSTKRLANLLKVFSMINTGVDSTLSKYPTCTIQAIFVWRHFLLPHSGISLSCGVQFTCHTCYTFIH